MDSALVPQLFAKVLMFGVKTLVVLGPKGVKGNCKEWTKNQRVDHKSEDNER